MKRKHDPYLRTLPWRISATYGPIEDIFVKLLKTGEMEAENDQLVLRSINTGRTADLLGAIRGILEFHEIAAERYGLHVDIDPIRLLINKLDLDLPLQEAEVRNAILSLRACKQVAGKLRCSQSDSIIKVVRIMEMQQNMVRAAPSPAHA